ncbi:amino acid/amide ABC transporter membrane protein 2, HAAT family [Rhizobiales bacterium GAS191]|jgi:branched-chain amino acid transport system permease protein|nr:amino acid/amide ABC transporter membrane protein 2, HAAT family [Rhizobiales bacterium GAS113]SED83127.1 amino acid/amide ABC transporter membrane protein 2, HAAT family [Rhizobiales bacterium GAS188]SEE65329.1 amino acid/amide ABC transporter membrane protein 2, HAAT family [Rhizobiales bacterium GAS191]
MQNYLISMAVSAGIYALMALGLNVIWGMAGMVNLGLVGFFAVGAYVSALLTLKLGLPIVVGMLAGTIAAALTGVLVTLVTARLRGDYMAIVTLGFAETIRVIANNEIWLTNGTDGLSGIAGPFRSTLSPDEFNLVYLCLVSAIVIIAFVLAERLCHSPFGRVLRAIRDDEQVAAVAGKPVMAFKIKAFAAGSAALGLAGALYGHYTSFIAPDIFVPLLTLYIKLSLLAGGLGNNRGAILGAVVVVFFLESSRFVVPLIPGLSPVQGAALREFLISVSLIVILRWRPGGLLPERITPLALPAVGATQRLEPQR